VRTHAARCLANLAELEECRSGVLGAGGMEAVRNIVAEWVRCSIFFLSLAFFFFSF
jgi:hypothetical protein